MTEIEEISLEVEEPRENTQEEMQNIKGNDEEKPAPKKRGRPPGAKNKARPSPLALAGATAPPAPPPKPKKRAVKKIEYETESESDEEPPAPRRSRRNGQIQEAASVGHMDRHQLASDVLTILQQQRYDRSNARRNHYASWFANM